MTVPTTNPFDRFMKYTTGKEPVITVNVIAAALLGAVVTVTERSFGFQWDQFSLAVAGLVALSAATWLARKGVFSPLTHEQEVDAALRKPPPGEA